MNFSRWMEVGGLDDLGRLDTPAHRLDARVKAAVTVAFIAVVMSFDRYALSALTPLALYPVFLVAVGRVPAGFLARKILLAAPFAVAVGLFNPFLDRAPALTLGGWTVSAGWLSFASILLRFALTVGAAVALVACTGMYRLAAGLERLGMPRVFATQVLFLYRYLFVVAEEGGKMLRGVSLRSPAGRGLPLRTYAALVGRLLLRALERAGRIHRAMVARGFDGTIRTGDAPRLRGADVAFALGWTGFFAVARFADPAARLGRWLAGHTS